MRIKEKLKGLLIYYGTGRQVGHTTLMMEGTDHYQKEKLVLVHNKNYGDELGFKNGEIVSWKNLDRLCGHRKPMVIDNAALIEILSDTLDEIERLEKEISKLSEQRRKIIEILN